MGSKQTFIQKLVSQIIRDTNLKLTDVTQDVRLISPDVLFRRYAADVRRLVKNMNSGTLGRIAAKGIGGGLGPKHARQGTALWIVRAYEDNWLGRYDSGRKLLREIVVTTLIASLYDHFRDQLQEEMAKSTAQSRVQHEDRSARGGYMDHGFFD